MLANVASVFIDLSICTVCRFFGYASYCIWTTTHCL